MASDLDFLYLVLEQLDTLGEITYKPMMGEYILYCRDKVVGGIYDNRLLLKATPGAKKFAPDLKEELPYPGAKPMLRISDICDRDLLCNLISKVADEIQDKKR